MYFMVDYRFIGVKSWRAWQTATAAYTKRKSAYSELLKFEYEPFYFAHLEIL